MSLSAARLRALLERARAGDPAAADSLIAGLRERILRWALVVTGDLDDAEDVAQQVSVTLHRGLARFEGRARFSTWLFVVVRHASLEVRGRRRPTRREAGEDELAGLAASTEDHLERIHDQEAARLVRGFFDRLPPRQRQLVELVDLQGCSAVEAAGALEIEPATARVHLLRARRMLRSMMLENHPELFE